MKSIVYVLCGIQASGKTTLAKELEKDDVIRYSFDELEDSRDLDKSDMLIEKMHDDAIKNIALGYNVVLDADYTRKRNRKIILNKLDGLNCQKILLVLQTPYEKCIQRNSEREEPIPENLIMWRNYLYEKATLDEGWDEIYSVQ